jgi:hypothetical protein
MAAYLLTVSRRCPRDGDSLQAFLCIVLRLVARRWRRTKERREREEAKGKTKETRHPFPTSLLPSPSRQAWGGTAVSQLRRTAPPPLLSSPPVVLSAPGAPILTTRSACPPQPGVGLASLHLLWRGSQVPPCCISHQLVVPDPRAALPPPCLFLDLRPQGLSEFRASGDDGPETATGDDGLEASRPEMTAVRVSGAMSRRAVFRGYP